MLYGTGWILRTPYGARTGTSVLESTGSGCDVTFRLQGVQDFRAADSVVPTGRILRRNGPRSLLSQMLPAMATPCAGQRTPSTAPGRGQTDPDGDGYLGIAFAVTGARFRRARFGRNASGREYTTLTGQPGSPRAHCSSSSRNVRVARRHSPRSSCGTGCSLLATGSTAATRTLAPYATSRTSALAQTVHVSRRSCWGTAARRPDDESWHLRQNVRLLLPHRPRRSAELSPRHARAFIAGPLPAIGFHARPLRTS